MINQQGGLVVGPPGNTTTYNMNLIAHPVQLPNDPYWLSSGSGIGYNATTKAFIWTDGRSGSPPSETDRIYWQQQRLFNIDNVNFEFGGTTNQAMNETMTGIANIVNIK